MPRYCDIVMKGGITSGVVYPAAVVEIAKDFTFKNVGGTSAGAIAAAITAAAERRRARDGSTGRLRSRRRDPGLARAGQPAVPPVRSERGNEVAVPHRRRPSRARLDLVGKFFGLIWAYPIASLIGALFGIVSLDRGGAHAGRHRHVAVGDRAADRARSRSSPASRSRSRSRWCATCSGGCRTTSSAW